MNEPTPLGRVSAWWYLGEGGNYWVYRQRKSDSVMAIGVVALLAAVFKFAPYQLFLAIFTGVAIDSILACRRAIILTDRTVMYRPPLGDTTTITLTDITSIEETRTISGGTFLVSKGARGVRISSHGRTDVFPLTVQNASDLLDRLRHVVNTNAHA